MKGIQVNSLGEFIPDMYVLEFDKKWMVDDSNMVLTRRMLIELRDELTVLLGEGE
jgi:hypothetical protein